MRYRNLIAQRRYPGSAVPGRRVASRLFHPLTASLGSMANTDRGIRTPTSASPLAQHNQQTLQPLHQPQEHPLPRVPRQQPVDQPPRRSARSGTASRSPPRRTSRTPSADSDRFSARCFSACRGSSGSSNAAHAFRLHARLAITMYAQLLTRSSTGVASACTPALELRDQVLLVAPVVGQEHDLVGRRRRGRW